MRFTSAASPNPGAGDRDEREAARRACASCPVLEPCRAWSVCLPVTDPAIYAGQSQAQRLRRKREALRALAQQALAGYRR
jgi:hypothetical protein